MTKSVEDPLVAQAFDAKKHEDLARAIKELTPDEAAFFVHKLERALRKRKLQLVGYLAAMGVWLLGMVGALIYFGSHDSDSIWVFAVPFGLVGAILYGVGRWSERIGQMPKMPKSAVPPPAAVELPKATAKLPEG